MDPYSNSPDPRLIWRGFLRGAAVSLLWRRRQPDPHSPVDHPAGAGRMMDIEPTPDEWKVYVPILTGFLRAVLAALGAANFTWAQAVSADQIQMIVGVVLMVVAAVWSAWQKIAAVRTARRQAAASAVASAKATIAAGEPVAVVTFKESPL